MRTVVATKKEIIESVQSIIDGLSEEASVIYGYNKDTAGLTFDGKSVIQLADDCTGLISSAFKFDVSTRDYDESRAELAVVGVGLKGQIGFNEVATQYDTVTHFQRLTKSTKDEYSFLGQIGDTGYTLGIKSIVNSKKIIVIALGEEKAQAVHGMLYGRDDGTVPAAFLQIPFDVTVYLDDAAASQI